MYYIGPPNLQDNLMLNIVENTVSVPIELSQSVAAFPEPTLFNWNKDGQMFTSQHVNQQHFLQCDWSPSWHHL